MFKSVFAGAAAIAYTVTPVILHATETTVYSYDARGRIIQVVRTGTVNNGVTSTYTLDNAGNRSNVQTTGASH